MQEIKNIFFLRKVTFCVVFSANEKSIITPKRVSEYVFLLELYRRASPNADNNVENMIRCNSLSESIAMRFPQIIALSERR